MKLSYLNNNYSVFANRGDMFNNRIHILKVGLDCNTLCGRPMLSGNYALSESSDPEVGCPECIRIYKEDAERNWFGNTEYYEQMKGGVHGSFAQSLASAWCNASMSNRMTLVRAFPDQFPSKYYYW